MSFQYKGKDLYCGQIKIENLAKEFGTPLYVYSSQKIKEQFALLKRSFQSTQLKTKIHFSVKSNSNLSILKLLKDEGACFDIVSGGEFRRLKKIGVEGKDIVFSGVGKTEEEIDLAIKDKICFFNVESSAELDLIIKIAKQNNCAANVGLRINPDVDASTHEYITTGTSSSKFGINMNTALNLYLTHKNSPYLNWCALDMHIGSQLTDEKPIELALKKYVGFAETLLSEGIPLKYLDVGGGLGIQYSSEKIINAERFGKIVSKALQVPSLKNATVIIEPGRFLVGESGILVTKLLYKKSQSPKTFYIVDAAMNDLIRPALYEAFHDIKSLTHQGDPEICVDVVGPVCESSDFFGKDRAIASLLEGDYLAVFCAGAYGASMASNYNSRLKPSEVITDGSQYRLIRTRESYSDLMKDEYNLL